MTISFRFMTGVIFGLEIKPVDEINLDLYLGIINITFFSKDVDLYE
jgi:hypothetical protein